MTDKAVSGGGCILHFGCLTATSGQFIPPGVSATNAASGASEANCAFYAPRPGKIRNMVGFCGSPGGTLTLRKNFVDTALTISANAAVVSDVAHEVAFAQGDYISVKGTGTLGADVRVSVEYV